MWATGVARGESGVLTDAVAVFGNLIFDRSGFADAVVVFGNVMFDISGFTDAVVVFGNTIIDVFL